MAKAPPSFALTLTAGGGPSLTLTVWSWFTLLLVIAAVAAVAVGVDGSMLRDIVCRPGTDQNQAPYFKFQIA